MDTNTPATDTTIAVIRNADGTVERIPARIVELPPYGVPLAAVAR